MEFYPDKLELFCKKNIKILIVDDLWSNWISDLESWGFVTEAEDKMSIGILKISQFHEAFWFLYDNDNLKQFDLFIFDIVLEKEQDKISSNYYFNDELLKLLKKNACNDQQREIIKECKNTFSNDYEDFNERMNKRTSREIAAKMERNFDFKNFYPDFEWNNTFDSLIDDKKIENLQTYGGLYLMGLVLSNNDIKKPIVLFSGKGKSSIKGQPIKLGEALRPFTVNKPFKSFPIIYPKGEDDKIDQTCPVNKDIEDICYKKACNTIKSNSKAALDIQEQILSLEEEEEGLIKNLENLGNIKLISIDSKDKLYLKDVLIPWWIRILSLTKWNEIEVISDYNRHLRDDSIRKIKEIIFSTEKHNHLLKKLFKNGALYYLSHPAINLPEPEDLLRMINDQKKEIKNKLPTNDLDVKILLDILNKKYNRNDAARLKEDKFRINLSNLIKFDTYHDNYEEKKQADLKIFEASKPFCFVKKVNIIIPNIIKSLRDYTHGKNTVKTFLGTHNYSAHIVDIVINSHIDFNLVKKTEGDLSKNLREIVKEISLEAISISENSKSFQYCDNLEEIENLSNRSEINQFFNLERFPYKEIEFKDLTIFHFRFEI